MLIEVALERERLFDRVEVLALQILDNGQFSDEAVVGFADARGDGRPTRVLRSPQPPFTRDELIPAADAAYQNRLQHVMFFEALGE